MAAIYIISGTTVALAEEENRTSIDLYAQAAVLMDAGTGRILFEKNGTAKMPMASTTKIMTCILALEYGNPDEYVAVSANAAQMPRVKLFMNPGEYYRLEDLLYSLMLESHNDSAVAIAEHVAGSTEAFARMMNQKARDIGCFDTYFITPNGLDAAAADGSLVHSTTARDLAAIMSYCINNSPQKERFLEITRTASYRFTNYKTDNADEYQSGGRSFNVNNHNAFLSMMEGALSGKTGFTQKAGYCYVGALIRDGRTYVVALLACGWPNNKSYKWSDTRKLMNYGLDHYFNRDIFALPRLNPLEVREGIPADNRPYGLARTNLTIDTNNEKELIWLLREDEQIDVRVEIPDSLTAPVAKGDHVGTVSYLLNGQTIREYPILSDDTVEERNFSFILTYLGRLFCL